jgi:hypothetical protein
MVNTIHSARRFPPDNPAVAKTQREATFDESHHSIVLRETNVVNLSLPKTAPSYEFVTKSQMLSSYEFVMKRQLPV